MTDIKALYSRYKQCGALTTDTRDCPEGSMFIALKGGNFDGNLFAEKALESGCALVVVDNSEVADTLQAKYGADRCVLTDDCLQTLKDLAREHRRRFQIPVIGITGTNGKTTTKELIAAVLSEKYDVLYTQGNFNNDVGVPKTLLRLESHHEIAIIEMGASHPGDIKTLVETAEPDCGLITNVGRAHLQGFGSFEGVMQTKGELYDFLKDNPVFINIDDEHLMKMATARNIDRLITYSAKGQGTVNGEIVSCDPFLTFSWDEREVHTQLVGAYNIYNALAAITVGLHFGVNEQAILRALEGYAPSNNRSQLMTTDRNRLVVDAYNANPSSMAAALENFVLMKAERKMAIIGSMGELGESSEEEHRRLVEQLEKARLNEVWLVGDAFKDIPCPFRKFHDTDEVKAAIAEQRPTDYTILIKGSNSVKLFELPQLL